jgi:hypothetical protein
MTDDILHFEVLLLTDDNEDDIDVRLVKLPIDEIAEIDFSDENVILVLLIVVSLDEVEVEVVVEFD